MKLEAVELMETSFVQIVLLFAALATGRLIVKVNTAPAVCRTRTFITRRRVDPSCRSPRVAASRRAGASVHSGAIERLSSA
jgi:hypothetical protein